MRRELAVVPAVLALMSFAIPTGAAAAAVQHEPIKLMAGKSEPISNQSTNWFGYNQGSAEQGGALFTGVSGTWNVPTATSHHRGEDEFSSTWVGIGGGCIDAGCIATDATLIQAGTEQDVDAKGKATYSTWWEIIPAPSIGTGDVPVITALAVRPGDRVHVDIREAAPLTNLWTISMTNLTTGKSWSLPTPIPYSSTHATAEWIEETPTIIDSSGAALAALPNLSRVNFDDALAVAVDPATGSLGTTPPLTASERIQLVEETSNSTLLSPQFKAVGTPSTPDPNHDGFNACAWSASCTAPTTT